METSLAVLSPRAALDRARRSRDPRFDGRFFVGVTSTGVYCRPICPAPSPRDAHVRYFPTAAGGGRTLTTRALAARAEAWRPWRGYAAVHLWEAAASRLRAPRPDEGD